MSNPHGASKLTTIDEGMQIKGTLSSDSAVLIHGTVEGEIAVATLTITERGRVAGQVRTQELRSSGTIEGHMTADTMYISGRVGDNTVIDAQSLEVNPERNTDPQFVVFGDCVLNVGEAPALRTAAPAEPAKSAVATEESAAEASASA